MLVSQRKFCDKYTQKYIEKCEEEIIYGTKIKFRNKKEN